MSFKKQQEHRIRISRYKLAILEALPTGDDVYIDELLIALAKVSQDLIVLLSSSFDEEADDAD